MGEIEVTVEEWDILLDHKRHGPTVLMREKAEAMLMLAEGAGIDFVARIVGRQPSTVNQWKRDFGGSSSFSVVWWLFVIRRGLVRLALVV